MSGPNRGRTEPQNEVNELRTTGSSPMQKTGDLKDRITPQVNFFQ